MNGSRVDLLERVGIQVILNVVFELPGFSEFDFAALYVPFVLAMHQFVMRSRIAKTREYCVA